MTVEGTRRLALVRDFLYITMPLEEVIRQLSAMPWDYEGEATKLTAEHLRNALQRYLQREVSEADIELWANQVEGRDDVQAESGSASMIEEVLYELANPLLTQRLDRVRAEQLMRSLTPVG